MRDTRIAHAAIVLVRHVISDLFGALRLNGRRMRRICGTIAPASIMVFLAVAALADDAPNSRLSDDIALTKATVSLLAARDFAAVRDRFDPVIGQVSDDTLLQMSDLIGASAPTSIETIWSAEGHSLRTGDGNSRILLEYGLAGKWVVVDVVVKTEAASKRFPRLFLTANALPLSELNAFHLFGKGPVQYLFLAGWIAVIGFTGWAITIAFRRHTGWRRWALIGLMPLGLTPTVAVNWNTAQRWVLELRFRKVLIALIAVMAVSFASQGASACGGFGGGGWRCGGPSGPSIGLIGLGLGPSFAGASYGAHGPYGYGFGAYGYDDGCIRLRRIMTPYGLRVRRVNVCY